MHSNVLSEVTTHLSQVTEQILRDFEIIQKEIASLHVKLCYIEEEKDKELRLLKQKQYVALVNAYYCNICQTSYRRAGSY